MLKNKLNFIKIIFFGGFVVLNLMIASNSLGFVDDPEIEDRGFRADYEILIDWAQNDPDSKERLKSIYFLERDFGEKSLDVFLKIAKSDSDFYVRKGAANALVRFGDKRAIPILKELIEEPSIVQYKILIALSLSQLGDVSGFKYLLEARDSKDDNARYFSVSHMGLFFKNRDAIKSDYGVDIYDEYLKFSKDSDPNNRKTFLFVTPPEGTSEEMMEKYLRTVEPMVEGDSDLKVRKRAEMVIYVWKQQHESAESNQD